MELKRIIARDSRAANEKAIQMYGPDVLVISSQRVDNQTELIVAVDNTPHQASAPAVAPESPAPQTDEKQQARFQAFSEVFKVNMDPSDAASEDPKDGEDGEGEEGDWQPAALRLAQTAAPASRSPASAVPHEQPLPAAELQRSRDTVELLRQEIAALRQEFNLNRQVAMWQTGQGLSPAMTQWFAQMQELGVPASLRTLMADVATDCATVAEAWPHIHKTLVSAIQRRKSAWPHKGVHALVGPSGAGKSLMIARMALAACAQVDAERMAIVSLADTKPGAWSQLQVLAAQCGVACYRAADAAALEVLLQELSHLQVIWIDTAGTDFLAHARMLKAAASTVALHAVLPLDATVTNVRKIFESPELGWSSLMLTKLDEAAHPWPVLKALCDHPLAISAVGAGHLARTAPLAFDARALVDLAMEGLRPQEWVIEPAAPAAAPARKTTPRRRAPAAKAKAQAHG